MSYDLPLFPERASLAALQVDTLFFAMLSITGLDRRDSSVCFILVFRRQVSPPSRKTKSRRRPHRTPRMEVGWIVIPLLIFIGMFVWGTNVYFTAFSQPRDALEINVVAKRWMWKFQHPEGQREINELHIPVNRPVKLVLASEDVIHRLLCPGLPPAPRRVARQSIRKRGSCRQRRGNTTFFARSIAAPNIPAWLVSLT